MSIRAWLFRIAFTGVIRCYPNVCFALPLPCVWLLSSERQELAGQGVRGQRLCEAPEAPNPGRAGDERHCCGLSRVISSQLLQSKVWIPQAPTSCSQFRKSSNIQILLFGVMTWLSLFCFKFTRSTLEPKTHININCLNLFGIFRFSQNL